MMAFRAKAVTQKPATRSLSIVGESKPKRCQRVIEFAMTDDDKARGYDGQTTGA